MSVQLAVPQILQNPELPNGCEITSCCEVLHYLGFNPDKCDLADNYLPQSAQWYGADPDEVYMGNPRKDGDCPDSGYYCFAGPVIKAANAYLAGHGGGYTPTDLTGSEPPALYAQLAKGRPVIFWASLRFDDIQQDEKGGYSLPGGRYHQLFHQLHCMVLKGYDDTSVYLADPLNFNPGAVPRAKFEKVYRQLGRRAVVFVPQGEAL